MPNIDGTSINGLLSTPLVLPASVAGALAALFIVLAVTALRRAGAGGVPRLLLPVAAIVVVLLTVVALLDRLAIDSQMAERRALLARNMELTARALAPGSVLACLDGGVGEATENACEKMVFADARSVASAVAYTGARLSLLQEAYDSARRDGDPTALDAFAAARRAVELDRYGLAAHVLASRDGCTAERCGAFAMLHDASVLKANLRAQVFDQYVSRYAADWDRAKSAPVHQPVAEAPAAPPAAPVANLGEPALPSGHPVDPRWDFPSAASIPPVSIMTAEPPLPKGAADGQTVPPPGATAAVPVPPKRPQDQATAPPPAR
jgi:hypothetical protein